MLKLPVYLYTNRYPILLDLDANQGVHTVMYQRNLIIQKGLKNNIQIQVKNSDQKPVPINGMMFTFNMFDSINNTQLLSKNLQILDDGVTTSTVGLALLSITESDTLDLAVSSYSFSVTALDSDGAYTPTYSNTYYGIAGTAEVRNDVNPVLKPSVEITDFQVYRNPNPDALRYEFYSGDIPANAGFKSNEGLHTAAVYMDGFSGTLEIQVSLANSPANPGNANNNFISVQNLDSGAVNNDFVTVNSLSYDNFTGIDYVNWTGNWTYVQFKWIPMPTTEFGNLNNFIPPGGINNPLINEPFYPTGKIDKILYRS